MEFAKLEHDFNTHFLKWLVGYIVILETVEEWIKQDFLVPLWWKGKKIILDFKTEFNHL